jgi:hypothetical protein
MRNRLLPNATLIDHLRGYIGTRFGGGERLAGNGFALTIFLLLSVGPELVDIAGAQRIAPLRHATVLPSYN